MKTNRNNIKRRYVVCVMNECYLASLEKRKIYQVIPDSKADAHKLIRVIDESGEDYLYPADYFVAIPLSSTIIRKTFARI